MAEMTIRRVGILSIAKIEGLIMLVVGLIIGVIYGLVFMFIGATMFSLGSKSEETGGGAYSVVFGLIMMVATPILYGIMGFIGGAIGAVIYNAAARLVGGIEIELEGPPAYVPPPPQQWGANPYPQT